MTDALSPAEHAQRISAALDRLLTFVQACSDEDWQASPLRASGDPRAVGVIADHVAHAYEYLGGWVREIVAGGAPQLDGALIDSLNAAHSAASVGLTQHEAAAHLRRSGAEFVALIGGLRPAELGLGDGRVGRFAEIAARHPDDHRADLEQALGR